VETVTSPPTAAASTASTTAIKKGPGSSVSVASEVVGICIFIGLIVIHPQGPIIVFNRKVIGFLKKAKPFELNFFIKKKKTFLQIVKPQRQNQPHSQLICLVPCFK